MTRKKLTDEEKAIQKAKKDWNKLVKSYKHTTESSLNDIKRYDFIPEPSYFFEIGDRVEYGAWDWTGVLDICEDGKYYKLFSINKQRTNRGIENHWKIHYEVWFRLKSYKTGYDAESFIEDDDIFFNYSQRDMYSLLNMVTKQYGIDLEPDYQRDLVWTHKQKVSLIDSVFKNIDIGKFTIIRRPWGKDGNKPLTSKLYEMLDGKQRLTTLFDFYTSKFKYKGKYFHELCRLDRSHFRSYKISHAECEPLTQEQKYRYFLKLNTGGVPIEQEHIDKVRKLWEKEKEKDGNTN